MNSVHLNAFLLHNWLTSWFLIKPPHGQIPDRSGRRMELEGTWKVTKFKTSFHSGESCNLESRSAPSLHIFLTWQNKKKNQVPWSQPGAASTEPLTLTLALTETRCAASGSSCDLALLGLSCFKKDGAHINLTLSISDTLCGSKETREFTFMWLDLKSLWYNKILSNNRISVEIAYEESILVDNNDIGNTARCLCMCSPGASEARK